MFHDMHTPSPIAAALTGILLAINRWVYRFWDHRHPRTPELGTVLKRLQNWRRRLEALVLAWERDQLPGRRPGRPRARTASARAPMPGRRGWAVGLIAYDLGGLLQDFANRDDIKALVQATPQAGRILRPMLHAFAEPLPDHLKLPPRPRRVRTPKPREPRLRLRPISFTRAQIARMTAGELTAIYGRLPPHFPLPIPNLNLIRRKIAAG